MTKYNFKDDLIESALSLSAIVAISYLALHGITNIEVITIIAGLGGFKSYRRYKNGG